jgi:hypothetical protein
MLDHGLRNIVQPVDFIELLFLVFDIFGSAYIAVNMRNPSVTHR